MVTGPFNSGKSTFVRTLGGRFSVDALIGNPVKPTTTVFMDFGTVEHNGYRITLIRHPWAAEVQEEGVVQDAHREGEGGPEPRVDEPSLRWICRRGYVHHR